MLPTRSKIEAARALRHISLPSPLNARKMQIISLEIRQKTYSHLINIDYGKKTQASKAAPTCRLIAEMHCAIPDNFSQD
jgi:hypothetical protein